MNSNGSELKSFIHRPPEILTTNTDRKRGARPPGGQGSRELFRDVIVAPANLSQLESVMSEGKEKQTNGFWRRLNRPPFLRLALTALALILYAQCVTFSLIPTWDDWAWFINRETVESWWAMPWSQRILTPELGYPVPIPTAIWAVLREWPSSTATAAAHGANVAFHIASTLLAFELGRRWLGSNLAAAATAALWTSHPLMAESVAWVTNLKTVGFGTCFLGTLVLWEDQLETPTQGRTIVVSVLVLACFGFRPEAVVLPAIMLLRIWLAEDVEWEQVQLLTPLVIAGLTAVIYTPVAFYGHTEILDPVHQDRSRTLLNRFQRTGAALWLQAKHTLYPNNLHPIYPVGSIEELRRLTINGWLLAIPLGTSAAWAWLRSRRARPWLLLAILTYLPASGFLYLPRGTADTYMYLPLLGLIGLLITLLSDFAPLFERPWKLLPAVGLPALILCLSLLTGIQLQRWSNPIQLWQPMTQAYPDYGKPYNSLGIAYFSAGEFQRATEFFAEGVKRSRAERPPPLTYPRALLELGQEQRAVELLRDIEKHGRRQANEAESLLQKHAK
jgi:hypothetical protein